MKPLKDTVNGVAEVFSDFQRDFETRIKGAENAVHDLRKATEPIRFAHWWRDHKFQEGRYSEKKDLGGSDRDNDVDYEVTGGDKVVHGCANKND